MFSIVEAHHQPTEANKMNDYVFRTEEITVNGIDYIVEYSNDDCFREPWNEFDGHGEVSEWTTRDKKPEELVLASDRGFKRYYDFAGACKTALKDGWSHASVLDTDTPKQRASKAAKADYEYLKAFCMGDWSYICILVRRADDCPCCGDSESLGGIEYGYGIDESHIDNEIIPDLISELENRV